MCIRDRIYTEWSNAYDEGTIRGVNVVPKLKINPGRISRGMPLVGQHNEKILEEIGIAPDEIKTLYAEGIIKKEQGLRG